MDQPWDLPMRILLATALAAAVAAGCSGALSPQPGNDVTPPAPARLTTLQACQRLQRDLARSRSVADIAALRSIADYVTAPRLAADARTAIRDMDHTGMAPVALSLLRDDCAQAGVQIPGP
jgi:hypothetical protein